MIDLLGDLPALMMNYGALLVGLLLLLGALGVPLPTTLLVVASGAFVRQGILDPDSAVVGLCCVVAGDSLSFAVGKLGYRGLEHRLHGNHSWERAAQTFRARGGMAVYLTRWLFTGIAIPTNLAAGGTGYRFDRFLLLDFLGELTWIGVYGGLGYWLGSQWEIVGQHLSELSGIAIGIAAALSSGYWLLKKLPRMTGYQGPWLDKADRALMSQL